MVGPAVAIERAFDDPDAIRALVEDNGPYPSIGSYLPPSATRGTDQQIDTETTLPWFRGNWAVNGNASVEGAEAILHNPRFIDAAARLFDTPNVRPSTVVVNVNTPMPPGAVHLDIPSFRGADRDTFPLPLLQAMGTSGLFEAWRIVEAGAITWFYDGPGGAYDYWPDGLDAPRRSAEPPFHNTALVADNDRMYHRIGRVGAPDQPTPPLSAAATIRHVDDGWAITDAGEVHARYPDAQVRLSVLWKAQVQIDPDADDRAGALSPERVVDIIDTDLRERAREVPDHVGEITDTAWLDLVHATYYPPVAVTS
jgi:hypothetical protein